MAVKEIVQASLDGPAVGKGTLGEPSLAVVDFGESLQALVTDLRDTMWAFDICVGLAAPQIGVNVRVAVVNPERERREDDLVLVNPVVLGVAGRRERDQESCMSAWGYQGRVERRTRVRLRYQTPAGNQTEAVFARFAARLVQHECDHLDGLLYLDRLVEGTTRSKTDLFHGPYPPPPPD